jgi:transglutaminase-like putative cysteine protease
VIPCVRALAIAAAAGAFAGALGGAPALLAAGLAAAVGARVADSRSSARLLLPLASAAALAWAGIALADALVLDPRPTQRLGAGPALELTESLRWLALCGPLAFALRSLARRFAPAGVAELALAAAALTSPLAAHRGGLTHRPLEIGDWSGARGIDPALPFLALGALAALALSALLLRSSRPAQFLLRIAAIALVAGVTLQQLRGAAALAPSAPRALGLAGGALAGAPAFDDELSEAGESAPVAIAILHDDWSPPGGVFYFRQAVFSQWNGQRLVQATRGDVDLDVFDVFPGETRVSARSAPPGAGRSALETTTALLVEHAQPFALDAPLEIAAIPNPAPERFARAFRVRSNVPARGRDELRGQAAGSMRWSPAQWAHYTSGPDDARYAELAGRIVAGLPAERARDPLSRALAIKEWLERNASYSRRVARAGAGDAVASFLFGERTGYCVHFAHAAALLMRALGLPARVAVGYALSDAARGGGSALLIRGADAHAWAELQLEGAGWVPVDPSPRQVLEALAPPPDPDLQRRLGELLRRPPTRPDAPDPTQIGVGLWIAAAPLALLVLGSSALGLWRRSAPRLARPGQAPRLAYRAALDRLCEVGLVRRPGETRERFAARVSLLAPSFAALTRSHLRAALGGRSPADPREPLRLYTEVRRELRARAPRLRSLGRLDPFAWWRVR